MPCNWIGPEISGHSFHFIDSEFQDKESLYAELVKHFGAVRFDEESMSLREISKTLIREGRRASAQ